MTIEFILLCVWASYITYLVVRHANINFHHKSNKSKIGG